MSESQFRRNRQKVTDIDGALVFLRIEHPSFSAPLLLVNDLDSQVSNGETYVGYPFGFKMPDESSDSHPRVQLSIDNVGRGFTDELERLEPGSTVYAKMMVADRSDLNYYRWETRMPLTTVQATAGQATATAGMDNIMRRSAVLMRHDMRTSPGIFT